MSTPVITIALCTSKAAPRFDWFFDSLAIDLHCYPIGYENQVEIIIVDYWLWAEPEERRNMVATTNRGRFKVVHVPPKPNLWQGPTRKPGLDQDCWAVSNARNTALGLTKASRLLWLDDVSIVLPSCVATHAAHQGNMYAQAWTTYNRMKVRNGVFIGGFHIEPDRRNQILRITGYDEAYDGARRGSDSDFGLRMNRAGVVFNYDPIVTQLLSLDDRSYLPSGKPPGENPGLWARVLKDHGRTAAIQPANF